MAIVQDYISSYTGEQIDNFNVRITALESNVNTLESNLNTKVAKGGDIISGSLILSKTTDASPTEYNSSALTIGSSTGQHLEFDPNEIIAKENETTMGTLNINDSLQITSLGQVARVGRSSSWINGRDVTLIRMTSCPNNQYCACVSVKTLNGSWEIGSYSNGGTVNKLAFSYGTDTNYNNNTNTATQCFITTAGAFTNASKRELKENIQDFKQSATDIINSIRICSFNMKADPEKDYRVGFIADDTNSILSGKYQDVMDLQNCIGILLKAVQELDSKINKLEQKIEEL